MEVDFKKFHVRGMNASNEAEKLAINAELKEIYENLNESDKKIFNEQLQSFLIKEMASIKSVYDGVKAGNSEN
jgi:hypothetical protein